MTDPMDVPLTQEFLDVWPTIQRSGDLHGWMGIGWAAWQAARATPADHSDEHAVTLDRRDLWDYISSAIYAALHDKIPKDCVVSWARQEATNRTMDIFQKIVPPQPTADHIGGITDMVDAQSVQDLIDAVEDLLTSADEYKKWSHDPVVPFNTESAIFRTLRETLAILTKEKL